MLPDGFRIIIESGTDEPQAIRCQHLSMITSVAQALIFFVLFIRKLVHLHYSIYKTSRDSCPTETPDQKTKPLRGNRNPYGQATLNCIKYGVLISRHTMVASLCWKASSLFRFVFGCAILQMS